MIHLSRGKSNDLNFGRMVVVVCINRRRIKLLRNSNLILSEESLRAGSKWLAAPTRWAQVVAAGSSRKAQVGLPNCCRGSQSGCSISLKFMQLTRIDVILATTSSLAAARKWHFAPTRQLCVNLSEFSNLSSFTILHLLPLEADLETGWLFGQLLGPTFNQQQQQQQRRAFRFN